MRIVVSRITFLLGLVTLLGILAADSSALACRCRKMSLPEELGLSGVVFEGETLDIRDVPEQGVAREYWQKVATMRVLHAWKGVRERTNIKVKSSRMCEFPLTSPGHYLVFATKDQAGNVLTSICSRTQPWAKARADVAELGSLLAAATAPPPTAAPPIGLDPAASADAGADAAASMRMLE